MVGDKFGKLKIIEKAPEKVKGIRHIPMWKCECECGNTITVSGRELRKMTSCGKCKSKVDLKQLEE